MMQSTMMPLNEPNFDADYILDFGDVIKIQLVGQNHQPLKYLSKEMDQCLSQN